MFHTQAFSLPFPAVGPRDTAKSSFVHWSVAPATRAIVFLHGLGGDPIHTWGLSFFRRLRASPKAAGYDIFSLSYESLRPALLSTSEVLKFASALFETPRKVFEDSTKQSPYRDMPDDRGDFSYTEVVFVCHSLGGLLFRRMAAEAHRKRCRWTDRVRAVLFAPAHRGGRPIDLVREVPSVWTAMSLRAMQYRFPILEDLDPDSVFVQQTEKLTRDAIAVVGNRPTASLVCNHVAHADNDRVVDIRAPFCDDPLPDILYGHSHTSICKVDEARGDALVYLVEALP